MSRRAIRGEAAAALAVLKLRERHTPAAVRPVFTLNPHDIDDLDTLADPVALDPAKGPPKPFHAEASYTRYLKVLQSVDRGLYAGSGPDFSTMKQGPIGDCYFFCLTGFLAAKHPDKKIRDMIQRTAKGNYVVRFFDGESFPVGAPTEAELLVNNSANSLDTGSGSACWRRPWANGCGPARRMPPNARPNQADAMASGGSTATVMTLYSGHKVKGIKLRDPQQAPAPAAGTPPRDSRNSRSRSHGQRRDGRSPFRLTKGPGPGLPPRVCHHGLRLQVRPSHRLEFWGQNFKPKGPEGAETASPRNTASSTSRWPLCTSDSRACTSRPPNGPRPIRRIANGGNRGQGSGFRGKTRV